MGMNLNNHKAELLIPTVQFGNIKVEVEGTEEQIVDTYFRLWKKIEDKKTKELEANKPF